MNVPHDVTRYALINRQNRSFKQHVTDRQTDRQQDTQHLSPLHTQSAAYLPETNGLKYVHGAQFLVSAIDLCYSWRLCRGLSKTAIIKLCHVTAAAQLSHWPAVTSCHTVPCYAISILATYPAHRNLPHSLLYQHQLTCINHTVPGYVTSILSTCPVHHLHFHLQDPHFAPVLCDDV